MEYRDIRYTVRARIERDEWTVSIHPADIESPRRVVTGREVPVGETKVQVDGRPRRVGRAHSTNTAGPGRRRVETRNPHDWDSLPALPFPDRDTSVGPQ